VIFFKEIVKKAISYGLVTKDKVLIDSTIVKASASLNSLVDINLTPEQYWAKLDEGQDKGSNSKYVGSHYSGGKINKTKIGRHRRTRNAFNIKKRSTTDPDRTLFYRPGQGRSLSYKAHVASDTVPELIEAHEKILGSPDFIAADTKYGSEECLRYLQEKSIKTAIKPETKNNR